MLGPLAEALDEPVADRERREERDLLRDDRADEHLERIGDEQRPEPTQAVGETGDVGVPGRERRERGQVEAESEQLSHDRLDLGVERVDVHAAGGGFDPHLASADDAVQTALVPEVREVGPERAEALGREREVVRLGQP